jgi:hypothetical protein
MVWYMSWFIHHDYRHQQPWWHQQYSQVECAGMWWTDRQAVDCLENLFWVWGLVMYICIQGRHVSVAAMRSMICIHIYMHTYLYTYIHFAHVCRDGKSAQVYSWSAAEFKWNLIGTVAEGPSHAGWSYIVHVCMYVMWPDTHTCSRLCICRLMCMSIYVRAVSYNIYIYILFLHECECIRWNYVAVCKLVFDVHVSACVHVSAQWQVCRKLLSK